MSAHDLPTPDRAAPERAVAVSAIRLMQGVVYQEIDAWDDLVRHQGAVRDHFAVVGLEVVIDDDEGYAYLRTAETPEGEDALPRVIRRRSLTYADSLLLVLLRKRLAEFDLSCTCLVPGAERLDDGLGVVVERGAGGELVSVDVDDDGVDPAQCSHDLLDRRPGPILQVAGYRERGEDDGQVRFDRVAGAVKDRPRLQVRLSHAEGLLDPPQVVIRGHDGVAVHHGGVDVGDVAFVPGSLAGPLD